MYKLQFIWLLTNLDINRLIYISSELWMIWIYHYNERSELCQWNKWNMLYAMLFSKSTTSEQTVLQANNSA